MNKDNQNHIDYQSLKQRLKNEISRRNGYGSMSAYASTAWDYTGNPNENSPLYGEYIEKLINPILYIKDISDPKTRQVNSYLPDLTEVDEVLTSLEADTKLSDTTSCRGACTGLCAKTCVETCTSCYGTCEGSCYANCSTSCGSGCSTGCGVNCQTNCSKVCSNACSGNCITECAQNCSTSCYTTCSGCSGTCSGGCDASCTAVCIQSCGHLSL